MIVSEGDDPVGQRIAITGGSGFIGSNLAKALCRENEVVVIDDRSSRKPEDLEGLGV